jgi:hypothetical protein
MTDEPISVIEEYLALVNEQLPESISEDVITELRTYMVETARDIGEGEITLQSAKKVVAQFGAPSEVAEEYKYSMLPETIPPKSEATPDVKPLSQFEGEPQVEVEEPQPRKDPTASPLRVFLQGVSIAVTWAFLVVLMSTLIGPIWLYPGSLLFLLSQIALVGIGLGVLSFYLKRHKTILWKRSYKEWSILQRFLTLPENVIKEPRDALAVVDILGSLAGVVMFLLSSSFSPTPLYIPLIVFPVSTTLLAKAFYGGKRVSSQDPTGYIKGEFVATFAALLFIDSSLVWLTGGYYQSDYYLLMALFSSYSILWGSVLLFQLVTRSGDLWWDANDSEPAVSPKVNEKLVQRTKNVAGSTILRVIGWIVLFTIVPTYYLLTFESLSTPWFAAVATAIFFGPVFLSPIGLYYLFRRWRIKGGKSRFIIGERSRAEALVDLAISTFVLFGFMPNGFLPRILMWLDSYILSYQYSLVIRDLGMSGSLIFGVGYVSSYLLLIAALGIRIIGDCLEFKSSKKTIASEAIMVSGSILILTLSLRVGVDLFSYDNILFPFTIYPAILLLAMLIAFQVETTRLKLREKKLRMIEESRKGNGVETSRMEVPSNIRKAKKHDNLPGN